MATATEITVRDILLDEANEGKYKTFVENLKNSQNSTFLDRDVSDFGLDNPLSLKKTDLANQIAHYCIVVVNLPANLSHQAWLQQFLFLQMKIDYDSWHGLTGFYLDQLDEMFGDLLPQPVQSQPKPVPKTAANETTKQLQQLQDAVQKAYQEYAVALSDYVKLQAGANNAFKEVVREVENNEQLKNHPGRVELVPKPDINKIFGDQEVANSIKNIRKEAEQAKGDSPLSAAEKEMMDNTIRTLVLVPHFALHFFGIDHIHLSQKSEVAKFDYIQTFARVFEGVLVRSQNLSVPDYIIQFSAAQNHLAAAKQNLGTTLTALANFMQSLKGSNTPEAPRPEDDRSNAPFSHWPPTPGMMEPNPYK